MSSPAPQFRSRMPRLAEAAVERVRLTVVPRTRTRTTRVPFVTLVTLVLLGGVVGLLLFNTSMQQASFATTALEQQATTLSAREQTLRMELDTLRDPQRVALRAQRMGMVPTTSPAFLDLGNDRILGSPVPASADDAIRVRPYPAVKPPALDPPTHVVVVPGTSGSHQNANGQQKQRPDTGGGSPNSHAGAGRND